MRSSLKTAMQPVALRRMVSHPMNWRAGMLRFALLMILPLAGSVRSESVPNADFRQADSTHADAPDGWSLAGGAGRWVDGEILEVTGSGNDSNYWHNGGYRFEPGSLYRFEMLARRLGGSGTAMVGPNFANRDYTGVGPSWQWYGHVFRVPEKTEGGYLRLGQWHATGALQFDAVRITPTMPVHRAVGDLVLGEGESIRDGRYQFHGTFGHEGSNFHRTLLSTTAAFNSNRWFMGGDARVTYRFAIPHHKFLSGEVGFNVNYHTAGGCLVEVSRDRSAWHPLATQDGLGSVRVKLPEGLLPSENLFLRFGSSTPDSSFQIDRVELEAKLDGTPPEATGRTVFADLERTSPGLTIQRMTLTDGPTAGQTGLAITVKNTGQESTRVSLKARIGMPDTPGTTLSTRSAQIASGASTTFELALAARQPGSHVLKLDVRGAKPDQGAIQTKLAFTVADFYRTDYGELLAGGTNDTAVWWCDATHKIPRARPAPALVGSAARMSAAGNDWEAVQIVVRPKKRLRGLTVSASFTNGPRGRLKSIKATGVKILRVHYHFVDHPTDATGIRDWWPDALPPLDEPIDVEAGQNQPLWILVHVPRGTTPGDYSGDVSLQAEGFSATVPLKLHVWNFTLPEKNHLETAFGMSTGNIFRYHNLKTDADKRKVLDMYFRSFAEHRISPYNPTPLDPIRVKFLPDADPPAAKVDFSSFDAAMTRAVEKFHFTGLRLGIEGMGGGTFHARYPPKIGDHTEETPQYQAMFASYVGQLEEYFRRKGWLDVPYVYWFDEPAPRDYEFVAAGMERLKKYAPGLRRMLTEEPSDDFQAAVDIWCPVSHNYRHAEAEKRRASGDRLWWYVCTGPKAPYCTLFIDHPATELRVWHWQTWQRNIVGTLVWQSNYWTSGAAFPDEPQNPYDDPMGYVSGYSTPRGTKRFWGNGDGRFIYPPLAAATPGASGPDPVIEPPVSSIRWEMLREGVEDYEFLYMLRELLLEKRDKLTAKEIAKCETLLEVPESITREMTDFTTNPAPIYARRAAIADAIEQLMQ